MTRILVTGGTGYIGSHTVFELQQAGYKVVIVDNLSNSNIKVLDRIEKITGQRPAFEQLDFANRRPLGTGRGLSVLEILDTFERVTGVKVPHQIVGRREGDIEKVWADPTFANNVLGWKAAESVESTLLSAWKWEQRLQSNQ